MGGALRAVVMALALAALPAMAAADITVTGLNGKTVTLTDSDLSNLPQGKAVLPKGAGIPCEGPTLTGVLRAAGVPTGPMVHGKPLRSYVIVKGKDGFVAILSLGETDPFLHPGSVILADKAANAPIGAADGPYRLVVGGDLRPWRAVRNVVAIEVKSAP